jgi:hypothetical protein
MVSGAKMAQLMAKVCHGKVQVNLVKASTETQSKEATNHNKLP